MINELISSRFTRALELYGLMGELESKLPKDVDNIVEVYLQESQKLIISKGVHLVRTR